MTSLFWGWSAQSTRRFWPVNGRGRCHCQGRTRVKRPRGPGRRNKDIKGLPPTSITVTYFTLGPKRNPNLGTSKYLNLTKNKLREQFAKSTGCQPRDPSRKTRLEKLRIIKDDVNTSVHRFRPKFQNSGQINKIQEIIFLIGIRGH